MPADQYTAIPPASPPNPTHEAMRLADAAWRGAMAHNLDDETVRDLVKDFIEKSYAYQKSKYGKIVVRLNVANIMRGGWRV